MNNGSFEWFRLDNAAKIFPGQNSPSWSNVFRLSVELKEEVNPVLLQKAADKVLPRFPSFAVRMKNGLFWHYLEKNPNRIQIREDIKNLCYRIKFKEDNGYLFRIYYHGKRISVDTYHVLSDGCGATFFLSTLVAEYLRLKGYIIPCGNFVLDLEEKPTAAETEDAYDRYANSKAKYNRKDKFVYHAVGTKLPAHMCNYTVGTFSFQELHKISKSYGVTITEFFAAMLIDIHYQKQLREKRKQRQVSVQVPVNLRKHFPSETLRNFVLCMRAKIDPDKGEYTFEEILKTVSLQLKLANDKKELNSLMTQNLKLERNPFSRLLPLCIKDLGVAISFIITGEQTTSTLISNIGPVALPEEMKPYIDRFFFFTGPGKLNGGRCGAISFGDKITFSFSNCYEESDLEREFFTRLVKMGLHVKIESNRE